MMPPIVSTTVAPPVRSTLLAIPFDSLMLREIVRELCDLLIDGQIQDIRQPEKTELQLRIHSSSGNYLLHLSAHAQHARVHLTSHRAPNAPTPLAFCAALRRHIEGGRVLSITQIGFDRVVEILVRRPGDTGANTDYRLIAEIMGKHSNLVLVDGSGKIVDSAKRVSHRVNRVRETLPGHKYISPPGLNPSVQLQPNDFSTLVVANTLVVDLKHLERRIRMAAPQISPFLAREIAARAFSGPDSLTLDHETEEEFSAITSVNTLEQNLAQIWDGLFFSKQLLGAPVKCKSADGARAYPISLTQLAASEQRLTENLNLAVDEGYASTTRFGAVNAAIARVSAELSNELEALMRIRESLERTILESSRSDQYSRCGELLLANLWQIQPGMPDVSLVDYYDPAQTQRTIKLDPKLTPQENAEAYFTRARNSRDGTRIAEGRLTALLPRLEQLRLAVKQFTTLTASPIIASDTILAFRQEMLNNGILREVKAAKSASGPDYEGHKIRRVVTSEGFEILFGENATSNDYLTTRVAYANDIWLHVRSAPSAHVVIRTNGKPLDVPHSVLRTAAMVCALHSTQKHSSLVAVDYTLKKHVRKPRGSAAGSVAIQQEKTLHVSPEEEKLAGQA